MYYVPWMVDWPRTEAMPHLLSGVNVGLIFMRQVAIGDEYTHFGASRHPVDNRAFYSNKGIMSFGPLYLYPGVGKAQGSVFSRWARGKDGRTPNLDPGFVEQIGVATELRFVSDGRGDLRKTFGPEDLFAYVYTVFHSPGYRSRYEAQLKLDFPRVPQPGNVDLFRELTEAGRDLLALHLLESPDLKKLITIYNGPQPPNVDRVGWSDGTVWLDAGKTNAREGHRATKPGTIGFQGVPEEAWNFHIGGYQVCHKWLKDRKGRPLSDEDIAHYQKIVVALNETIRITAEIDEVIEAHGGWPTAFETASEPAENRLGYQMAAEPLPGYVVKKVEAHPVYSRSRPDIERTLRSQGITPPRTKRFAQLDQEGKLCAIWCVLHGEGSLSQDDSAVKLCAIRLKQLGWADFERLDPRSDLYCQIDETLKSATRQGNGWLDRPANLHVRAYRRFPDMRDEEWRDCVVSALSHYDGPVERYVVVRDAFNEACERFGIGREKLVRSVEAPIRSAINGCIRRGFIRREGPERLVLLASHDDPS